jgi:outer membrane receptor protein involved in Fe transport
VGDVKSAGGIAGTPESIPANMGSNYAVYVDKNGPGAHIVGYRDGDNWYDQYGKPTTGQIVSGAGSNGILPLINVPGVDNMSSAAAATYIKSAAYDPSVSFTEYKAQYMFMPRLQYSFNITNQAQFFAHYDVLSQRPQARNDLNLAQYYFFTEYAGVKNNPDLKPIKKTDYEFGFKQQVAEFAAVTLSAFYQETRNLIDIRKIQYAFPATYTTYDNIDFRSAKGVRLLFDMRRIQNFKLSANYTLQFVEGTGSDDQSAQFLVSANQPNFRTVYPISTDSRHQIKFVLDYRFEGGRKYNGPIINNYQVLADFGINLLLNLRSGTPTRESSTVVDEASITSGARGATTSLDARLPWYTRLDLRVNKDFTFKINKQSKSKDAKVMGLSVYVYVQNLLNTANVLSIYPYTLNANDDGYLKAASSQVNINSQPSVQAYKDLYKAKVNNPDNYSLPRRVYLGVSVNF